MSLFHTLPILFSLLLSSASKRQALVGKSPQVLEAPAWTLSASCLVLLSLQIRSRKYSPAPQARLCAEPKDYPSSDSRSLSAFPSRESLSGSAWYPCQAAHSSCYAHASSYALKSEVLQFYTWPLHIHAVAPQARPLTAPFAHARAWVSASKPSIWLAPSLAAV